jgi:hypothetical protein
MPCIGFAISALPPSAAIVRAARQIDLAPSGKVSNSFNAALIHEMGLVLGVIGFWPSRSPHNDNVVIFDNRCPREFVPGAPAVHDGDGYVSGKEAATPIERRELVNAGRYQLS